MIPTAPNNPNECANYFPRRKTTCLNWLWEGKKEKQYGNAINGGRWSTCLPGGTAQRQVGTSTTSVVLLGFSKWGPFFPRGSIVRVYFSRKDREKIAKRHDEKNEYHSENPHYSTNVTKVTLLLYWTLKVAMLPGDVTYPSPKNTVFWWGIWHQMVTCPVYIISKKCYSVLLSVYSCISN